MIAKRDLKLARTLKRLARFDAVIIDDIGYVQQDREEMEVLLLASPSAMGKRAIEIVIPKPGQGHRTKGP